MTKADALFRPARHADDDAMTIAEAVRCVETFTERFNARDLNGMDADLHFPHVILSGEQLVIWTEPGNLPASFFDDLDRDTRWAWLERGLSSRSPARWLS